MELTEHLLDFFNLSVSNFYFLKQTLECESESFWDGMKYFYISDITDDITSIKCAPFKTLDTELESVYLEQCKAYDNINNNFRKLEGCYNDINQYYEEILYCDITDSNGIRLVKRLGIDRSCCQTDLELIYNMINGLFLNKKLCLVK
jgi:hypothetical protein